MARLKEDESNRLKMLEEIERARHVSIEERNRRKVR